MEAKSYHFQNKLSNGDIPYKLSYESKKKIILFFFVLGIEKSHSVEILNYRDDLKCIKSNLEIDDERPCVKCNIF